MYGLRGNTSLWHCNTHLTNCITTQMTGIWIQVCFYLGTDNEVYTRKFTPLQVGKVYWRLKGKSIRLLLHMGSYFHCFLLLFLIPFPRRVTERCDEVDSAICQTLKETASRYPMNPTPPPHTHRNLQLLLLLLLLYLFCKNKRWAVTQTGLFSTLSSHQIPGKFWNVVLENDGEDELDRSCEIR